MAKKSEDAAPMRKIAIRVIELPAKLKKQIADERPKCSIDTVRNALVLTNPRQGEQHSPPQEMFTAQSGKGKEGRQGAEGDAAGHRQVIHIRTQGDHGQ